MNMSRRLTQGLAVTGSLITLWAAMMIIGTGDVDQIILATLYAGGSPMVADVARAVTLLGDGRWVTVVAIIAGLFLMRAGRLPTAVVVLVGTGIGRGLTEIQKLGISRLRPDGNPHLVDTFSLSFPSGHSANAMMIYLSLALLLPQSRRWPWIAGALLLAALVGLSRIMLGVHWPSDVIGGWSYGALWAMLLVAIDQMLRRRVAVGPADPA